MEVGGRRFVIIKSLLHQLPLSDRHEMSTVSLPRRRLISHTKSCYLSPLNHVVNENNLFSITCPPLLARRGRFQVKHKCIQNRGSLIVWLLSCSLRYARVDFGIMTQLEVETMPLAENIRRLVNNKWFMVVNAFKVDLSLCCPTGVSLFQLDGSVLALSVSNGRISKL